MNFFILLSYLLLISSIFTLWVKQPLKKLSYIFLIISIVLALITGLINFIGLVIIYMIFLLLYLTFRLKNKPTFGFIIFFITAIILFLNYNHILPGFHNFNVINKIRISKDAIPFSLYLNYSSLIITYPIILFSKKIKLIRNQHELYESVISGIKYGLIAIAILLPLSWLLQFVKFDFKVSHYTLIFIFVNLIFTCIPEEIFWRGFIQTRLQKYTNPIIAILISSVIFASIHV